MKNDGKSSAAFLHISAAFGNISAAFLHINAAFGDINAAFLHISANVEDIDAAFPVVDADPRHLYPLIRSLGEGRTGYYVVAEVGCHVVPTNVGGEGVEVQDA